VAKPYVAREIFCSWSRQQPEGPLDIDGGINGFHPSPADGAIVKTLIQLAHRPGLTVTAECVEPAGQATRLRRIGGDTGQDRLHSRAVVSDMIDALSTSGPARSASA
jgi:EAL domain-containing protein (putative c-di-GMP-specific phosphodiesterase class I)